jgi:hypothetical protein
MDLETISSTLDEDCTQLKPNCEMVGKRELIDSYATWERHWEIA